MLPLPDAQLRAVPAVPFKNPNNYVQVWAERLGKELWCTLAPRAEATAEEPRDHDE